MDLVDDIDLEAGRDRAVPDPLDDFARVVDTRMACRVDFQNIYMAASANGLAWLAGPAQDANLPLVTGGFGRCRKQIVRE